MRQPASGQTRWRHPSGITAARTAISSDVTSRWRQNEQDQRHSQMDAGLHHGLLTFPTERGILMNGLYILGHTLQHATLTRPTAVTRSGSPLCARYSFAHVRLGKKIRPALRLRGESPVRHLLKHGFGNSVAIWLRN